VVPQTYPGLRETPSADYSQRTSWNVRDTDATIILVRGPLHGGSAFTRAEAERLGRPVLVVDLAARPSGEAAACIRRWLAGLDGSRLNVAGPRSSSDPELPAKVSTVLEEALGQIPADRNVDEG
jgi:hypothetical protein